MCTFYWVCEYVCCVFVLCMFLLHLFGTVASVQLKTLFRSHRLLCNGIVHNAHTTFSLYYIRLLYSCVCDWCFFFLTSVFTICWVFSSSWFQIKTDVAIFFNQNDKGGNDDNGHGHNNDDDRQKPKIGSISILKWKVI